MNELALFAGAGGGILGGKLLGWRTRCAVEIDAYARARLLDRQAEGCLEHFPIWDDVTTFDGTGWRGHIDVVSGGFPCQDISAAGKGAGIRDGKRSGLWAEYARIVSEVQPRFVWVENSPMLTLRGLDVVLGDLSALGYDATWGVVSAADAGAPHLRERIWILAYAEQPRLEGYGADAGKPEESELRGGGALADADRGVRDGRTDEQRREQEERAAAGGSGKDVSDAEGGGLAMLRGAQGNAGHADGVHEDVADSGGSQSEQRYWTDVLGRRTGQAEQAGMGGGGRREVRDAAGAGFSDRPAGEIHQPGQVKEPERPNWWAVEPDVGGTSYGLAQKLDLRRSH